MATQSKRGSSAVHHYTPADNANGVGQAPTQGTSSVGQGFAEGAVNANPSVADAIKPGVFGEGFTKSG